MGLRARTRVIRARVMPVELASPIPDIDGGTDRPNRKDHLMNIHNPDLDGAPSREEAEAALAVLR